MNEPLPYKGNRPLRLILVAVFAVLVAFLLMVMCSGNPKPASGNETPVPPQPNPKNFERAHHWLATHNPYSDGIFSLAALLDSIETETRIDERAECIRVVRECLED